MTLMDTPMEIRIIKKSNMLLSIKVETKRTSLSKKNPALAGFLPSI
ncbi:MAG: hypothetical protein WCJ45_00890 [bacterium]